MRQNIVFIGFYNSTQVAGRQRTQPTYIVDEQMPWLDAANVSHFDTNRIEAPLVHQAGASYDGALAGRADEGLRPPPARIVIDAQQGIRVGNRRRPVGTRR